MIGIGGDHCPPIPAAASCPSEADQTSDRTTVASLLTVAGCILTAVLTYTLIYFLPNRPASFFQGDDLHWWAHIGISFFTIILTLAGLLVKDVYKSQTNVALGAGVQVDIFINFWK